MDSNPLLLGVFLYQAVGQRLEDAFLGDVDEDGKRNGSNHEIESQLEGDQMDQVENVPVCLGPESHHDVIAEGKEGCDHQRNICIELFAPGMRDIECQDGDEVDIVDEDINSIALNSVQDKGIVIILVGLAIVVQSSKGIVVVILNPLEDHY